MKQVHDLKPGSPERDQFRLEHGGASEAAAMLGLSKYMTRAELLRLKHSGVAREFNDATRVVFANGHAAEKAARPHVEAMIGEDLFPSVVSDGYLSCSTDGLTLSDTLVWEHKQINAALFAAAQAGVVPDEHMPQCQQALMVTGALECIFTVSDGTPERMAHVRVKPDLAWFERLFNGWAQFREDLANYTPTEVAQVAVATPIRALPAVSVQVSGAIAITSNLDAFGARLRSFVDGLPKNPSTDQEFADAKAACKTLQEAQDALDAAEAAALGQVATVDEMRKTKALYFDIARMARLALEKLVAARELAIRTEIVAKNQAALDLHRDLANGRLGAPWLARAIGGFAESIKGKRTVASCEDAASTALANAKIEMSARADLLDLNRKALVRDGIDYFFLFADFASAGLKPAEDFNAVAAARIAKHVADENARVSAMTAEQVAIMQEAKAQIEATTRMVLVPLGQPPAPAVGTAPTLKLGTICERLAIGGKPMVISAEQLAALGVVHRGTDKRAMLYSDPDDWFSIKQALVNHIILAGPQK